MLQAEFAMTVGGGACSLPTMSELADRIREARERAGMNQSELARKLGVSPQTVQQWEKGGGMRGTGRAAEVAKALGVTVNWLMFGEDKSNVVTLVDRSPHTPRAPALLVPAVSAAYATLRLRFQLAGREYDLARDPGLFALAYAWAIDETPANAQALKAAVEAALAKGT